MVLRVRLLVAVALVASSVCGLHEALNRLQRVRGRIRIAAEISVFQSSACLLLIGRLARTRRQCTSMGLWTVGIALDAGDVAVDVDVDVDVWCIVDCLDIKDQQPPANIFAAASLPQPRPPPVHRLLFSRPLPVRRIDRSFHRRLAIPSCALGDLGRAVAADRAWTVAPASRYTHTTLDAHRQLKGYEQMQAEERDGWSSEVRIITGFYGVRAVLTDDT